MDINELLDKAGEYLPEEKVSLVRAAYKRAVEAHQGQLRCSGEAFVEHPLQAAITLAELHLDAETLAAALLHDVPEDCSISLEEIKNEFGSQISKLVDSVTKLKGIGSRLTNGGKRSQSQNENLRKMLVAMSEDIRVILIKLADRLHNMQTLGALPVKKRHEIAQETLDIYAPLAHRLGMRTIKWQLEDLSFRFLEPREYHKVARLISTKLVERQKFIDEVTSEVKLRLQEADIEATVFGRPKHLYSTYQKIHSYAMQGKAFSDIHDLFALRVLVNSISDCYKALGAIHNFWHPIVEDFNDYIANPKDNGYQSLHTTVMCRGTTPLEIQIRTNEMHRIAKYGVAAHWLYKEGGKDETSFVAQIPWLHEINELRDGYDSEEFIESVKTDVLTDRVYVYSPKGEIKELPKGATPLDFAFRIHTDLGYRCIGAKVNDRLVPLNYLLKNADVVEIIASKTERGPSLDWLNPALGLVKTSNSRNKIKQWFNKQERGQNIERGRELLDKEFKRLGVGTVAVEKLAHQLKYVNSDDFLSALGSGGINLGQVTQKLTADLESTNASIEISPLKKITLSTVKVLGVGNLFTRLAACCNPLPGDKIIGYITQGSGITIHQKGCPNIINEQEKERLIEVSWGDVEDIYPVGIQIDALDRVGLIRDISLVLAEEGVNITDFKMTEHDTIRSMDVALQIKSVAQLNKIMSKIQSIGSVVAVVRKGEKNVSQ
jgi:GTP diphosphokinase / guanosine-3',5'-bis(diphosphate) 3'-diphosphatase